MKRAGTVLLAIALVLWFAPKVFAGGARVTVRSGHHRAGHSGLWVAPGAVPLHTGGFRGYVTGYPYRHYHHYHYPPRFHGYYHHRPIVVVAPYRRHFYYYAPPTVVLSSPFYCFAHHEGFVSRVGFLDHISGTHKIPLETAAAVCPESEEVCIIED